MNLTEAYVGAMKGLNNNPFILDARKFQLAICKELALTYPRGNKVDGQQVTSADLARLKERGERRLK